MEETKKILSEWQLEHLVPNFEENAVVVDMFDDLMPDLIKELIPKIGDRILFLRKLKSMKEQATVQDEIIFSPETTVSNLSDIDVETASTSSILIDENHTDITSDILRKPFMIVDGTDILGNYHVSNMREIVPKKKTKWFSLIDLLQSSNTGKALLEIYKKSSLESKHRQQLVDIIIANELQDDPDRRLTSDRFEELSNMIVDLFPKENKEIYFTKITILRNGKTMKSGKGKLFARYYNMRNNFKKSGLLERFHKNCDEEEKENEPEVNLNESIMWLQNCVEPWSDVHNHWVKTFHVRQKMLAGEEKLCHYFKRFPCLRTQKGYLLLELDFEMLYADNKMMLFNSWDEVSDRIIKLSKKRLKDENLKSIVDDIESENLPIDAKVHYVMFLLAYLMSPITVCRSKDHGRWRPSKLETIEGFWLHLKTISEMEQAIAAKKEKLQRFGLTLQSIVIVIGPTLKEIHTIYVRIDEVLYTIESSLKALDVCFKSIHALSAEYSAEAEQVWYFIQKGFYRLSTKWDKEFTNVHMLLSDMQQ